MSASSDAGLYLKSSRHQRERYIGVWLPELVLTADAEPLPGEIVERREAVSHEL